MVIGKTSTSISKTELFDRFPEVQVLTTVFPEVKSLPCKIHSPFRTDTHPSFSIYLNEKNHVCFKDFGEPDCQGSLLDLLCRYWNCTFRQVFDRILNVMQNKTPADITVRKSIKTLTRKEVRETKIEVAVRPWKSYDMEYWNSFGISRKWLDHAEVYPISHKIITKKDAETGKTTQHIIFADKYAYVFVERKENRLSLKIYQPFNTVGFKWCSKMDASVISLWTKVPQKGERIVICSSLKDSLTLSCQLQIPAIALQGEGYSMSDTAVSELKRRFHKVFICFDVDAPGIKDAQLLAERTGFINIVPDLGHEKDLSDYYKSLEDKTQFQQLKNLFV